jgi:glutamate-1-semialdehyde aminotransferase
MEPRKGPKLWKRAKKLIPGGSQLFSKRSELFLPERWPAYYGKAKGVVVWDLDGNKYIDMSYMGIGACILGYSDPDVNRAVKEAIDRGSMSTLNCPEEIELAELLLKLHPWAGMVRYTRSGGEAMAVAVRIARAQTGKDKIAFCGYHGWHDWYLSANLANDKNLDGHLLPGLKPRGVPRALANTALPFNYNLIDELEEILSTHEDIAAVVMEPVRHQKPRDNFLQKVRKITSDAGAILIFDEITSGWRVNVGGVHMTFRVYPDIAVFAKAMSNGFPMGAVIGKSEVMDAAQESFISSTYWTEKIGPVATLATIRKMIQWKVPRHLCRIGKKITHGWIRAAQEHGLEIKTMGMPPLTTFTFEHEESQILHTLFTQEMLDQGFLASKSVYVSYAHNERHVIGYLEKVDTTFAKVSEAASSRQPCRYLKTPVAETSFKRLV